MTHTAKAALVPLALPLACALVLASVEFVKRVRPPAAPVNGPQYAIARVAIDPIDVPPTAFVVFDCASGQCGVYADSTRRAKTAIKAYMRAEYERAADADYRHLYEEIRAAKESSAKAEKTLSRAMPPDRIVPRIRFPDTVVNPKSGRAGVNDSLFRDSVARDMQDFVENFRSSGTIAGPIVEESKLRSSAKVPRRPKSVKLKKDARPTVLGTVELSARRRMETGVSSTVLVRAVRTPKDSLADLPDSMAVARGTAEISDKMKLRATLIAKGFRVQPAVDTIQIVKHGVAYWTFEVTTIVPGAHEIKAVVSEVIAGEDGSTTTHAFRPTTVAIDVDVSLRGLAEEGAVHYGADLLSWLAGVGFFAWVAQQLWTWLRSRNTPPTIPSAGKSGKE